LLTLAWRRRLEIAVLECRLDRRLRDRVGYVLFRLAGRQIVRWLRPLAVAPAASAPAATSATAPAAGIAFRARWPALFAVAAVARRNHFGRFFLALGFARRALIGSRLRNEAAARTVFLATAPAPAPAPAASIAVLGIAALARAA